MSTKLVNSICADFTTQLTTLLGVAGTTASLASQTDDDGVTIPDGSIFVTIDGGNSQKEHFLATKTGLNLSAMYSISRQGVQTSGAVRLHRVGASVVMTDWAHLKYMNDLLKGTTDLDSSSPLKYDGTASITNANHLATKAYVDGIALAGAGPASTSSAGLTRLSASPSITLGTVTMTIASPAVMTLVAHGLTVNDTVVFTTSGSLPTGIVAGTTYYVISAGLTADAFEVAATAGGSAINTSGSQSGTHTLTKTTPVSVADTDYRLNKNNYAADAQASDTYVITLPTPPSAYAAGQLFQFKANTVNTGPCTLNVNSLGAKSLKMNSNLDPVTGYIKAGAIVTVIYDGTNFQILSVSGKPSVSQTGEELYAADGGSTDDYAVTLDPVPVAYVTGMTVRFKANTINTTGATLNVNALGAKAIVKYLNTALKTGDIVAGMLCTVMYDGTNFVLQNPIFNVEAPLSTAGVSAGPATSSTQTITHGLGRIPTIIELRGISPAVLNASGGVYSTSFGLYNSSGNRNIYSPSTTGASTAPITSTAQAIYLDVSGGSASGTGVIQNVTLTSFDIVWTLSGSTLAAAAFMWEAK